MSRNGRTLHDEHGAALLTAIFYTLIIALMAASIIGTLHVRTLNEARQVGRAQADLLAKTAGAFGVLLVTGRLGDTHTPALPANADLADLAPPNWFLRCELDEGLFELTIEDEAGKIDLNTGPLSLLEALAGEIGREDIFITVRDFRASGRRLARIEEALDQARDNRALLDVLERTVTVYSQLPGIDFAQIPPDPKADPLRRAAQRLPALGLRSPRRVFRFNIAVRLTDGLEYGRVLYVRTARGGETYTTLGTFTRTPAFDTVSIPSTEACQSLTQTRPIIE